ncbi:hypothetical protein OG883_45480 [Streptomyces sp. NBC_01142]|uniref:hypothetical protein n=1 Tax=Streptomyces sp. NBC_01142 TaxID=2975865 RepID=UPI00225BFED4|nr:hypothetical protein [Streptomyces sp. NBC_01142]MCX4826892.1 hypothetical protein [Streptomyces sp. NBC_01142]
MSRDSNNILLRQQYTGEPRQAAHAFYQARGLYFGLVPDATDPAQQLLEAAVVRALARPHPQVSSDDTAGTFFGLRGVSPDVDTLVLWPHPDHLTRLLGRILPVRTPDGIAGVAGLRARPHPSRTDTLLLARPGHPAHLTLRARPTALKQAEAHIQSAGMEPLWSARTPQPGEQQAWDELARTLQTAEAALWSRALRRAGLYTGRMPDWTWSAPELGQLDGPKPRRIAARAVGPAGGPAHGIVAVTTSAGQAGLGCTTAALTLSGALARTGARVALLGADTPNGLHRLLGEAAPRPGEWYDLLPGLPSPGTLRGMILPPGEERARVLLDKAARAYDTVVIDAGSTFQLRHLVDHADAAVVLTDLDREVWGTTEVLDRRPDWVQMWDWLNTCYLAARARVGDEHSRLLHFLDEMFELYFWDRSSDGNPDVYDATNPEDTNAWWDDFVQNPEGEDEDDSEDDTLALPEDVDEQLLGTWREQFLVFLTPEGSRRHPHTWAGVAAVWIAHNRNLQMPGPPPGTTEDNTVVQKVLSESAELAIDRWDERAWQEHHPRWAAADARTRSASLTPWRHLLEENIQPADPAEAARFLRAHLRGLGTIPIALTIAHIDDDLDHEQHQLAAVRDALRTEGIATLTVFPDLPELTDLRIDLHQLSRPSGPAAAAGNRLALVVANLLAGQAVG